MKRARPERQPKHPSDITQITASQLRRAQAMSNEIALPHLSASDDGVVVKALEWRGEYACFNASTVVGVYVITEYKGMKQPFKLECPSILSVHFDTLEAAKAAAQADYQRRIRSALTPANLPGTTGGDDNAECRHCGRVKSEHRPGYSASRCIYQPPQATDEAAKGGAVDEIDVTGWGVWKGHAIPVAVARHIAAKINERIATPAPSEATSGEVAVTDEMIVAALLAYYDRRIWINERMRADMRRALETTLASLDQPKGSADGAGRETLRNIAEGNLGDGPGQANYARIKAVALAALSSFDEPKTSKAMPGPWPPLKKALWVALIDAGLNEGQYLDEWALAEKLYRAAKSCEPRVELSEAAKDVLVAFGMNTAEPHGLKKALQFPVERLSAALSHSAASTHSPTSGDRKTESADSATTGEFERGVRAAAGVAEGPLYRERYRGHEGRNWTADGSELYGKGRIDAAADIRALLADNRKGGE
jgi:hypothetical protein